MPDWITHIAAAYILCTILGFKYKQFNPPTTAIVMVGALIPDIYKIGIVAAFFGFSIDDYIAPLHLPIGSVVIGGMISLFFQDKKMIFLFLALGIATHYALDLLLTSLSGGIILFYPFYWGQWQLGLVPNDDYHITIVAVAMALVVYGISYKFSRVEA